MLEASNSRLQRAPDFTGGRIVAFRQVFLRHGLPGLLLAALLVPFAWEHIPVAVAQFRANQPLYLVCAGAIVLILCGYAFAIDRRLGSAQLGWILYLGALSLWEEWAFRVAIPYSLEALGLDIWTAILWSNALFAVMHYFTLRWKWYWCVGAFLGGLALSRQYDLHQDLLLITAYHWLATYLNTPRAPSDKSLAQTN